MDQMGEELKKVLQAGMGAVATGVEKTQEVFDKLSKKGEPLYQQAKKTVSDAVDSVKQAVAGCGRPALSGLISALRQLSPEERALIREALDELDAKTEDTCDPGDEPVPEEEEQAFFPDEDDNDPGENMEE